MRAWFLHAVPDLVYNHVMVTDAATYQSLGHLIEDVRHAVMTTGHRVISVDMIDDRLFTFRLVNEAGSRPDGRSRSASPRCSIA